MNYTAEKFLLLVAKLQPLEFIGICKGLGVEPLNPEAKEDEKQLRDLTQIFAELGQKFESLGRPQRKKIIQLLRQAVK